jgi:dTDP-4-amino-4,6-dideoxygalactose transaminase
MQEIVKHLNRKGKEVLNANPKAQYKVRAGEIESAIKKVLESGWYILGKETEAFEIEFARYLGTRFAVGVGSGTEALHLALKCLGIGPGDEVATVSFTAVATVAAIELTGASPVFADIDPITFTMDPASLETVITPRTKAVIPVHLYGQSADMKRINRIARARGIKVIEDCAQAHGATIEGKKVGTFGDMACFSFYPTKNLGAIGDGGTVTTNHFKLCQKARLLRQYGWKVRYISQASGWNTRLDELQAAILRVKLPYLDQDNLARRQLAELYCRGLAETDLVLPRIGKDHSHVFHLFVVRSKKRDLLFESLRQKGIQAGIHYPVPIHLQPAYRRLNRRRLQETERAANEILSLPIYPELSFKDVGYVIKVLKDLAP